MWAPLLAAVLLKYPNVRIVLSTSWARELGFSRARDYLPESLRHRVIGATWHSQMASDVEGLHPANPTWWDSSTRYQQIKRWVSRAGVADWLAIDDVPEGWDECDRHKLIQLDGEKGLSDTTALTRMPDELGKYIFS
jgi:hypothetical protein